MSRIADIAAERRTVKLLPDATAPLPGKGLDRATVDALVAAAGWAPFHRACVAGREGRGAVEPWRVHALDKPACLALLPQLDGFAKPPGKIANMLAAADALLLVTWLPEEGEGENWAATELNMEHIAAAGAMIQTLLLAATEGGIGSYWSSGGCLATPEVLADLGAQSGEVLLGAIFLWPDAPADVEAKPGKLRAQRTAPDRWTRWVDGDAPSR